MRSLVICIIHLIFLGNQIKKNEKRGECNMYGESRGVLRVLVRKPEGNYHLEDPGIYGRIIFTDLQEVGCEGMDWTNLAQDRNRWRVLVISVMNLRAP